jgi:hypothetical protein
LNIPGLTGQPDYTATVFQPWWLDLSGLCVLLAGLWFFCRATPQTETPPKPALPPVP